MKRNLLTCFMLVFFLVASTAVAQDRTISGKVTGADDGLPLPGVTILIKGTTSGQSTNVDGEYTINVAQGSTLVFRYLGYVTQEIAVGNQTVINVKLAPDVQSLGEVVVTGYGSTTEERASIASSSVSSKNISLRPNASVVQTLGGQVAGLSVATTSGQPGANSTVQLRGVSSINGDTEPLFVIDGAPVDQDNFRSLNPNEIESVTVLKDAGATAIYGNRGANGVIVITTKNGGFNSGLKVSYSGILSFNQLQENDYDLMNSQELLTLERSRGTGRGNGLTDAEIAAAPNTSWLDFFFRTGTTQNHNLNFTGGGENSNYFVSFGYFDQEGVLKNSSLERYNLRTNLNGKSADGKFTYGVNLSLNFSENDEPNSVGTGGINQNFVLGAYQAVPYLSPDDYIDGRSLLSPLSFTNTPLFLMDKLRTFTRKEDEIKIITTLRAGYQLTDDLSVNYRISADFQEENRLTAQSPESFNAILFAQSGNNTPGLQAHRFDRDVNFNQVASINWNKQFGKHSVDVGVFTEYFKAHQQIYGFTNNGITLATFAPGDGASFIADNAAKDFFANTVFATKREAGLFSYFMNANWDYDGKYGAGVTVRRDASYRFAESNRWGTFFSVSGRWNLHNESFMDNVGFDLLKLRASYGETGNQNITGGNYFSAPDLTLDFFAAGGGYEGQNALFLSQIANTTLRWETVKQLNIGTDFELLDRRLRGNVDYYVKTTEDLFQSQPVSAINATTSLSANVGSIRNSGIEFTLNYDVVRSDFSDGLNVTVGVVGNYNKTEILEFPGGVDQIIGTGRVGGKLFEYFSYRYAGVNPANGNLLWLTADGDLTENPNVDTDRVWTDKNVLPDLQGGINLNVDYKGFFLQAQFNYATGRDRFDFDYSGFINPNNISQFNFSRDLQRAWTPENRNTDIASLDATNLFPGGSNTRFLRNADYLQLRFLQVGYTFDQGLVERIGLSNLRLFANAENILTISEWRGFDVQAQTNGSRLYPVPRIYSVGIELGLR